MPEAGVSPEPAEPSEPEPQPIPVDAPTAPEATPSTTEPAASPLVTPIPEAVDDADPGLEVVSTGPIEAAHRRMYARFGGGIGHCSQFDCEVVPMGGVGTLEVGWRARYVAFGAVVSGGGGKGKAPNYDSTDEAEGELTFLFVGPKIGIRPATLGVVDPHFDVAIGWSRIVSDYSVAAPVPSSTLKLSRGAVELGGGIDIFASEYVAFGPAVSLQLPFAGEVCLGDRFTESCEAVRDVLDMEDGANARALRRSFPRIWTVTFAVTIPLGAPAAKRDR